MNKTNENIVQIKLSDLPNDLEAPEPSREFLASIKEVGIIYPIIICEQKSRNVIIDGRRRIAAARILEFDTIPAMVVKGFSPEDRAIWALILNEQRSANVITEYRYYSELIKKKDWETLKSDYGFNKNHITKVLTLGKIEELETFISAYEQGLVAESTLFEIAKLDSNRQKYVTELLEAEGKLSLSDVREAKKISKLEAIGTMPRLPEVEDMPTIEEARPCAFAVEIGEGNAVLCESIDIAFDIRSEQNGKRTFKLFEI